MGYLRKVNKLVGRSLVPASHVPYGKTLRLIAPGSPDPISSPYAFDLK